MVNRSTHWYIWILLALMTLPMQVGCVPQQSRMPRREYSPPSGTVEIAEAIITPFFTIDRYSFSPNGRYLAASGVAKERDNGKDPEYIFMSQPTTVMVLEWPSLQQIWRRDLPEDDIYPLAFHWSLNSDSLWMSWYPDGRISRVAVPSGETTTLESRHAGMVFSPDGEIMITWGEIGTVKPPGSGGSRILDAQRLFVYHTSDFSLDEEIAVPVDGVVTTVYWGDEENTVWLLVAPYCSDDIYLGFPYISCGRHSLYHLSLSDETLELYWSDFTDDTEGAGSFNPATNLLLDQDGGLKRYTVVDLERRCTVYALENRFGELIWFDENKFAEMYPATMEERNSLVRIYEVTALTTGEKTPCLPSE